MRNPEYGQEFGSELRMIGDEAARVKKFRLTTILLSALLVLGAGFLVWLAQQVIADAKPQQPVHAEELHWAYYVIELIEVRDGDPPAPYDRAEFGPAWSRITENGCDVRTTMLMRDLEEVELADNCTVASGVLHDRYSGTTVQYSMDSGGDAVQVDHIVSLSDAWKSGAWAWDPADRESFANHSVNLLTVSAQQNQAKSSYTAADWLPADRTLHCWFVVRQLLVKDMFGLSVTQNELEAYQQVLPKCVAGAPQ